MKTTKSLPIAAASVAWGNYFKRFVFVILAIIAFSSNLSAINYCSTSIGTGTYVTTLTATQTGANQTTLVLGPEVDALTQNFNIQGTAYTSRTYTTSPYGVVINWPGAPPTSFNIYFHYSTAASAAGYAEYLISSINGQNVCVIAGAPTLATTTAAGEITSTSATSGGNVTDIGTSAVTARGVCWSTSALPTVALATKTVDGEGAGSFTSSITGLSAGTTYYVRSYATNSAGTAYGAQISFMTSDTEIPTAFTATKGAVGGTTVELLLNATDNSGSISYTISYGTTPTVVNTTGTSGLQKSYIVTGLTELTAYTFSVVAKDASNNAAANNPIVVEATTLSLTPQVAATTPPVRNSGDVLSIFSDAYTPVAGTRNYNPAWGQSGSASIVQVATNNTLKYLNLNYQGTIIGSNVNAAAMTHLHVDIWTPDETSLQFYLVTTNSGEKFVQLTPLVKNAWNTYDIPLTNYTSQAGFLVSSIKELKVVGSGNTGGQTKKTVYLDNIYFYKYVVPGDTEAPAAFTATKGAVTHNSVELLLNATDDSGFITYTVTNGANSVDVAGVSAVQKSYVVTGLTPETAYTFSIVAKDAVGNAAANNPVEVQATTIVDNTFPTVAAPTPTIAGENVISLFSNAYTNVGVDTWRTGWSSGGTLTDLQIAGNDTKKYSDLVFVGIETTGVNYINATLMTHVHFDAWTPNVTTMKIKLVDFGANAAWGGGDDVEFELTKVPVLSSWNSFSIPLSEFTGLTTKEHMAQYIFSGAPTGIVYIDNFYFYKDLGTSVSEFSTASGFSCYPNPVMNQLTVNAKSEISQVIVRNLLGQNVKSMMVNGLEKTIDLSDISAGNYFVTVILTDGQFSTQKIVKL